MSIGPYRLALAVGALLFPLLSVAGAATNGAADRPAAADKASVGKPASAKKASKRLVLVPIQASIPEAPMLFVGKGQRHLAYEIWLMNWSTDTWTIQRIEVNNEGGSALRALDGHGLADTMYHPARSPDAKGRAADVLAPGESAVAYMWVDLAKDAPAPAQLRHKLTVKRAADDAPMVMNAAVIGVRSGEREISAPLRGKNWLAVNGPANDSAHRRAMPIIDGVGRISQRYAIDWLQLGDDMKSYHGDSKDNRNYHCFGSDALAVADGVVAELKDGIPENVPNEAPIVPITLDTIAGNHINLDLGGGVYAMYAHLQPGSLRVKLGDKVKRGQVLGLVGNTGNSSEPHLHFQLMDHNSPLASEGVPYTLPEFTITQRVGGDFPAVTALPIAAPELHRAELPMDMQLVEFK